MLSCTASTAHAHDIGITRNLVSNEGLVPLLPAMLPLRINSPGAACQGVRDLHSGEHGYLRHRSNGARPVHVGRAGEGAGGRDHSRRRREGLCAALPSGAQPGVVQGGLLRQVSNFSLLSYVEGQELGQERQEHPHVSFVHLVFMEMERKFLFFFTRAEM